MSIKDRFYVEGIKKKQTYDWLVNKHYAGRIPSINFAFGLFDTEDNDNLVGVCTFGKPPAPTEEKMWGSYELWELNRLVTNDYLPENTTSFFVSQSVDKVPEPCVLISYADLNQATNWIYTGVGSKSGKTYIMKDGTERHSRHDDKINMDNVKEIRKDNKGKARYYYFVGNKRDKREMREILENREHINEKPYPKGDNKEYDASYQPDVQEKLF